MSQANKEYDEQRETTAYVWRNCQDLFTEDERLAEEAFVVEGKLRGWRGPLETAPLSMIEKRTQYQNNSYVQEALRRGYQAFHEMVRDRILTEYMDSFLFVRCPDCNRILRSASAKQCIWCGRDWHHSDGVETSE